MNLIELPVSLADQRGLRAEVYLSEDSRLPLQQFCDDLGIIIHLPEFSYDGENEYQWGFAQVEQGCVEGNISRPHNPDQSGFVSYTISLMVSEAAAPELDKAWLYQNLMPCVLEGLKLLRGVTNDSK